MNEKGEIDVEEARMYIPMVAIHDYARHTLTLQVPEDVALVTFTFGS